MVEPDPEENSWKLTLFDPFQKSPVEAPSPIEQPGSNVKEEIKDDERRTSSDDYANNKSNSSTGGDNDKSDDEDVPQHRAMPPPSRAIRSTPDSLQRTPDTTILNSTLQIINDPNIERPLSSLSDSDDNASSSASKLIAKPKNKRPKKVKAKPRNSQQATDITSSDEAARNAALEEKATIMPTAGGRQSKKSAEIAPAKISKKSPKVAKANRQKPQLSRPLLSSDSSSDDDEKEVKKPPRKRPKSPEKQIPDSTIATSSDDEVPEEEICSPPRSSVEVPRLHSDSESNHSSAETAETKINDKKKNMVFGRLFGSKTTSEGGKGGKGGKGKAGGGQVVVITHDEVQAKSADIVQKFTSPASAFNSLSIRVSIPFDRFDVLRAGISEEKLKLAGYRPTKSPAKKARKMSSDSWRVERKQPDAAMYESDSSSEQMMENPAQRPTSYTTPNYSNDRMNNNVDAKHKDLMVYQTNSHSPSSNNVDSNIKLPKVKNEKSDTRKEKLKPLVKVEKSDELDTKSRDRSSSMNSSNSNSNHSHASYKASRKRPRDELASSLMPPTNHERMQNGDLTPPTQLMKLEQQKKVYFSYFERTDETDHEFR